MGYETACEEEKGREEREGEGGGERGRGGRRERERERERGEEREGEGGGERGRGGRTERERGEEREGEGEGEMRRGDEKGRTMPQTCRTCLSDAERRESAGPPVDLTLSTKECLLPCNQRLDARGHSKTATKTRRSAHL